MAKRFYYVYILVSRPHPEKHYVGWTEDLDERLDAHNAGRCRHTDKFRPWRIETAVAFASKAKALGFEAYLKSHSGRAFAKRHL